MKEVRAEAKGYLKRALTLAPNLAYAHAALAMVQNFPPESGSDLRKAVLLDPGSAEAWTWLGTYYANQNRFAETLKAQSRAVEIEPLWWTAVGNKISTLVLAHDRQGLDAELSRIERMQDPVLLTKAQWRVAFTSGHPGDAVAILLKLRSEHPEEAAWVDMRIATSLIQLGFVDEGIRARRLPATYAAELRGTPLPARTLEAKYKTPGDFWQDSETAARYARLLPNNGRLSEWLARYRSSFRSADDFVASYHDRLPVLLVMAPTVAANLRAAGDAAQADSILRATEPTVIRYFKNGPWNREMLAEMAYYRAADGKADEAVNLLSRAVALGWLPDEPADIAEEPCFAGLVKRTDFQAVRQRILTRLAEEGRKISPAMLASSGLGSKMAA
jgi:tetratricopeptide (TPR) repeat protein